MGYDIYSIVSRGRIGLAKIAGSFVSAADRKPAPLLFLPQPIPSKHLSPTIEAARAVSHWLYTAYHGKKKKTHSQSTTPNCYEHVSGNRKW